ncbi:MAG: addiction module antidote protein [Sedimenticola sp.]
MPKRYKVYETAEHLQTPEDIQLYLEAVMEEEDPQLLLMALGDVVKATKNIAELSREIGVSRETLYKALSEEGNPRFSSLTGILHSLGLGLSVRPLHHS